MAFRDTIISPHVAFGLVPEILDAVDVVAILGEKFRVIDAMMVKFGDAQHIV